MNYGKRPLTDEEQQLLKQATEGVQPIVAKKHVPVRVAIRKVARPAMADLPVAPLLRMSAPLHIGAYAGIDRNTADSFRKGKYPIDAALDLHGMSREQAHMALSSFVHAHYTMGHRCLLLVCGKGAVLREQVPHWLDEPGLRPFVLALEVAKQQHGGSGAYYILLRRKRA